MVDKSGMIRLRRKKQKEIDEYALKETRIYFGKLIDFIVNKILDDNYVLVAGDERSIKEFSVFFRVEPLIFEYNSIKFEDKNRAFFLLKKDNNFKDAIDSSKINDTDFGKINAEKLVFMIILCDNLTDQISIGTIHTDEISIEKVRPIIKNIFELPEHLIEKFKNDKKFKLIGQLTIKGIMNNMKEIK